MPKNLKSIYQGLYVLNKLFQIYHHPSSTEIYKRPPKRNYTTDDFLEFPVVSEGSQQADQTLPLLNLLLNLVAGGGNLSLCGQNSTQEGSQRASYRCVERPAERALSRPKGQGLGAAVAHHLLRTPTGRVQHEAHHQQQASNSL